MEEQLAQDQLLAAHRPVLQVAQDRPAHLTRQAALNLVAQTLHHRLVVQEARAGDAFDPRKHARVEAQRDGGGLTAVRDVLRGLHQGRGEFVVRPKLGFVRFIGEFGNLVPTGNCFHG